MRLLIGAVEGMGFFVLMDRDGFFSLTEFPVFLLHHPLGRKALAKIVRAQRAEMRASRDTRRAPSVTLH